MITSYEKNDVDEDDIIVVVILCAIGIFIA